MFQLQLDIAGDKQVMRGFSRFADGVKDFREPLKEILEDFHEIEKKQFSSEGGYGSGGWAPLAPVTVEQKARAGYPYDILVRTGDLRDAMTGGSGSEAEVTKDSLKVMMPWYGKFHQQGTRRMPRRPVVQLQEADKTRWSKIFHEYLVNLSRKEFAGLMDIQGAGMSHLKAISKGG